MANPRSQVIIIGAGVIGVCAAHRLAQRGAAVTLIDSGAVGGGCSFGNAGLISLGHLPIQRPGVVKQALRWMFDPNSPLYIAPRLDPALLSWLLQFRRACTAQRLERNMKTLCEISVGTREIVEEIHSYAAANGGPDFFYDPRGYMEVYRTKPGFERGCANGDIASRFGFDYERVESGPLLAMEPALAPDVVGAVWHRHSAFCDPHKFVQTTAWAARRFGAEIIENAPIQSLRLRDARAVGVTLQDGREMDAETIVLAAGSWSPPLAAQAGVRLPMQPAKGYHRDVGHVDPPLTTACVMGEANMVCTPMGPFMRLAGTLEFSGVNLEMRRNRLGMLNHGARTYLRGFTARDSEPPRSEWVGMRPCSPDGLPILGWAPRTPGLFIATGHAMLGLSQGPVTGRIVSECILDGGSNIDIHPMRVDRF